MRCVRSAALVPAEPCTDVVRAPEEDSFDDGTIITNPGNNACSKAAAADAFAYGDPPPDVVAPCVAAVRAGPSRPAAGTKVNVTAAAFDLSGVASAQVRIGKGKPVAMTGVNGVGNTVRKLTGSIKVPTKGTQSICVRATDTQGKVSAWVFTRVTVMILPPEPTPAPAPGSGASPDPGSSTASWPDLETTRARGRVEAPRKVTPFPAGAGVAPAAGCTPPAACFRGTALCRGARPIRQVDTPGMSGNRTCHPGRGVPPARVRTRTIPTERSATA